MEKTSYRTYLVIFICFGHLTLSSQVPNTFNYQGVARTADGEPISSQDISIRLSIHSGSADGTVVFSEAHIVGTNEFGLFNLLVGQGSSIQGALIDISWSENTYFLQTELDVDGGSNYIDVGTTQIYAVPYAIASAYAENDLDTDPINEIQSLNLEGNTLSLSGSNAITLPQMAEDSDDQMLSLEGSMLSISGGNSVDLNAIPGLNMGTYWAKTDDSTATLMGLSENQAISFSENASAGRLTILGDMGSAMLNGYGLNTYGEDGGENVVIGPNPDQPNFGNISLHGAEGASLIEMFIHSTRGYGSSRTRGPNGNLNTSITTLLDHYNYGYFAAYDAQGMNRSALYVDEVGAGRAFTRGPNGNDNISLATLAADPNNGYLAISDSSGSDKAGALVNTIGCGEIFVAGPNGFDNVSLGWLSTDPDLGFLAVNDNAGETKSAVYVAQGGAGEMFTTGSNGSTNVWLADFGDDDHGGLGVYNDQDQLKVGSYANPEGAGQMWTNGANGNLNIVMSTLSTNRDLGYVSVHDGNGDQQAGIYVDENGDGRIFADMKNFKVPHPTDADMDIVYTSLEGPEAAAYLRGTANLSEGKAEINFPEHFQHIISDQGLTVVLTPMSAASKGLAVVKKSKEGIEVVELFEGKGDYAFDWEIKAVRSGYEDYQVLQRKVKAGSKVPLIENKLPQRSKVTHERRAIQESESARRN